MTQRSSFLICRPVNRTPRETEETIFALLQGAVSENPEDDTVRLFASHGRNSRHALQLVTKMPRSTFWAVSRRWMGDNGILVLRR